MIIAYVQSKPFQHWQDKINARLDELHQDGRDNGLWSPAEIMDAFVPSRPDLMKLQSCHRRTEKDGIADAVEIMHLWMRMN